MRNFPIYPVLGLLLLAPMAGCDGEAKDSTTPTDDSKATDDSKTTDDDSGTITDDTGPTVNDDMAPPYNFAGSVTISQTINGVVQCDADATLTGTPYTGDCEDCDFALEMSASITRDASTDACGYFPTYSFVPSGGYNNLLMIGAALYEGYYYDYANALMFGYGYTFEYYGYEYDYPGPYIGPIAYDGSTYGTFSRTGDDIAWTFGYSYTYNEYSPTYTLYCEYFEQSDARADLVEDGSGVQSDLDCSGAQVDVWTFEVDGETEVKVTVDTVADASAFDPQFYITDAAACAISYADDNFDCTYPPPTYQCPAANLGVLAVGTYTAVVGSWNDCNGSIGTYELRTEGTLNLTLTHDDVDAQALTATYQYETAISGSGTLTAL